MGNEIAIAVTGTATGGKAAMADARSDAKRTGQQIGDALDKGFKDGERASERTRKKIGDDLDKTRKNANDTGGKAGREFGSQFSEQLEGAMSAGGISDIVSGLLDQVKGKGGAVAAGATIATGLLAGFGDMMEKSAIAGLVAAQLGTTRAEAQRYGRIAGDVYASGFGEAIEDVRAAVSAVLSTGIVDQKASDRDIRRITELASTASKVVGVSVEQIADAVRAMLKSGLADSAEQAFDLIVAGFQRGADAGHDMVDVLTSSSVNLHRFGLDGASALGVLKQALDAGAPSADSFTGAIEELVGNAADGIPTFERLGLGGAQFAAQLAGGGPRAAAALDALLDRIRAIEDPAQRSATVVELFGEEATALQSAILAVDPSRAALEMKNFAGTAKQAADDIVTSTPPIERAWRNLKDVGADIFNFVFADPEVPDEMKQKMEDYQRALQDADREKQEFQERVNDAAHAWEREAGSIKSATVSLEDNIRVQKEAADGVMNLAESEIRYHESIDQAADALKKNGKTLDINSEKGRENKQALLDIAAAAFQQIEAMEQQGATTQQVSGFMQTARDQFIDLATKMLGSKAAAEQLATKLGLIPGNYVAQVGVNGAEAANNQIRTLHGALVDLTNRDWVASVSVTQHTPFGGGRIFKASGGPISNVDLPHAATGGIRWGNVITDELGPEIKHLPDGSMVIPSTWSREILARAFGERPESAPAREAMPAAQDDDRIVQLFVRALEKVTVSLDGRAVGLLQGRQASLLGRTG